MPRPRPNPIPVPFPRDRVLEIAKNLTNPSIVIVKPGNRTKKINTRWLGYLVMESLSKYQSGQRQFGRSAKSFDGAMKPIFDKLASNRVKRIRLNQLVDTYQQSIRGRVRRVINNEPVTEFLKSKSAVRFSTCAKELLAAGLIADAIKLETTPTIEDRQCRRIYTTLSSVYCHDDSEWSADEPYIMTGAELFDEMGTWEKDTELSNYAGGVSSGNFVEFEPPSINKIFDWRLENPADGLSLSPVTAVSTITLMEHDQGDKEQYYNAFKAGYAAAKLLLNIAAGTTGGPVGIAIGVISIIVSLALALDGEDELGTVAIRYDDVLGESGPVTQYVKETIKGRHKGNYYKYDFSVLYTSEDYSCPVRVPFGITGPKRRTVYVDRGPAKGGYAIVCPAPLRDIKWKVAPIGATVQIQGKRYTKISFRLPGTYQVSVTAKEQSGIASHSKSMTVTVNQGQRSGPYQ